MVFPTSPTVGQVFTSGGRSWVWTGSSWDAPTTNNALQIPFGLVLLRAETFTSASIINANNVFTTEFTSYYATLELTSASAGGNLTLQYTNNTTPYTGGNYNLVRTSGTFSATMEVAAASAQTQTLVAQISTNMSFHDFDFGNISATSGALAPSVLFRKVGSGGTGGFTVVNGGAYYSSGIQATGFGLTISSGTMNGRIRIYGKRSV